MATDKLGPDLSDEPTIGRLIGDTTRDFSALIHSEIELAKTELKFTVKSGGLAVVLFAVAGFVAVLAVIMASIAFGFALMNIDGIGPSLAFVIVFGVYLLVAGILVFVGVRKVKQVRGPDQAIAEAKSITQVLKRG
jgi:hypothetical protein